MTSVHLHGKVALGWSRHAARSRANGSITIEVAGKTLDDCDQRMTRYRPSPQAESPRSSGKPARRTGTICTCERALTSSRPCPL